MSLFKGRVDDRVYGAAEPVTLFTSSALLDLRPFTLVGRSFPKKALFNEKKVMK